MKIELDDFTCFCIDELNKTVSDRCYNSNKISKKTGNCHVTVGNWLKKKQTMPLKSFFDICRTIGVPPDIVIQKARARYISNLNLSQKFVIVN